MKYLYQKPQASKAQANIVTWHERLGHISSGRILESAIHVNGLHTYGKLKMSEHCKLCALTKTIRSARPAMVSQCREVCDRIYTDVFAPFRDESIGGTMYFVTIIDDFSGYSMIKFIKSKSDADEAVKDMIISLENLCRKLAKFLSLKTGFDKKHILPNGGEEYTDKTFLNWLQGRAPVHDAAVSYSADSNRKVKRLNLTLLYMARPTLLYPHPRFCNLL